MALAVLSIDLEARLATLQAGMDKAGRLVEKQATAMAGAFDRASAAAAGIGSALAGALAGGALLQSGKAALDIADKVDDLAEKYGIAAGKLSEYRFAAEVAGTPTDSLATGLQKLSKAASEGNKGLALMGISVKDGAGALKSADTLLLEVADKFAGYREGAEKAALAQEVFGKSGADMIPLLNKGRAGIADLREEAVKLGAAFGSDLAKAAGDFNDNLKRLELATQGAKIAIVGDMLPALDRFLQKTLAGIKAFGGLSNAFDAIVLKSDPLKGPGELLRGAMQEVESNSKRLQSINEQIEKANANQYAGFQPTLKEEAKQLAARNAQLKPYLEYLKESQRIEALAGSGGVLDARDARLAASGAQRGAAPILSDGKLAEEAKKQYDALIESIRKKRVEAEAELATGQKLTEQQKFNVDILAKLDAAESKLSPQQKSRVKLELEATSVTLRQVQAQEELAKSRKYSADLLEKTLAAHDKEAEALAASSTQLHQQAEAFGLTATALEALTLRRLDDEIAQQRLLVVSAQNIEGNQDEAAALQRKVALLERQRAITADLQSKAASQRNDPFKGAEKAVSDYLQRTVEAGEAAKDAISGALSTLENDLVNGLAAGKLDVRSFVDYMIKEFLRLQVVKPLLNDLIGAKGASGGGGFIGSLMSIFGFAKGGAFAHGVQAFASGGVVSAPSLFGMSGGRLGLMGEAGPEAIMPLKRGLDGRLGVAAAGGGTVVNNYNVAAGVTRNELVSSLQMMANMLRGEMAQTLRRSGVQ